VVPSLNKKRLKSIRGKRDEEMRKLELRHIQEALQKDEGNTLRRYLDKKLRKELCMSTRRKLDDSKIRLSKQVCPRWDQSLQSFIVYHCAYHDFNPHPKTIQTKCLKLNCAHLTLQKRKEIIVKTLQEAVDFKNRLASIRIEQVKSGYRLIKNQVH